MSYKEDENQRSFSMIFRGIGGAATGTVIGFAIGGPIGAAVLGKLGGAAGAASSIRDAERKHARGETVGWSDVAGDAVSAGTKIARISK